MNGRQLGWLLVKSAEGQIEADPAVVEKNTKDKVRGTNKPTRTVTGTGMDPDTFRQSLYDYLRSKGKV
jgi:hypothetical protein